MELKQLNTLINNTMQYTFNRTLWNWNVRFSSISLNALSFNRTLWNWNTMCKPASIRLVAFNRTLWNWNTKCGKCIECRKAFNRTLWNWNFMKILGLPGDTFLLIVPYGIETIQTRMEPLKVFPFNRTLWNWNK